MCCVCASMHGQHELNSAQLVQNRASLRYQQWRHAVAKDGTPRNTRAIEVGHDDQDDRADDDDPKTN